MKKKNIPVEFVYQLFALIIAIIIVHAFYVSIVRPTAAQVIEEQNMLAQADTNYVRERSVWVLVKDFEQESCFILMFWALAIMIYKGVTTSRNRALLQQDLLPLFEEEYGVSVDVIAVGTGQALQLGEDGNADVEGGERCRLCQRSHSHFVFRGGQRKNSRSVFVPDGRVSWRLSGERDSRPLAHCGQRTRVVTRGESFQCKREAYGGCVSFA